MIWPLLVMAAALPAAAAGLPSCGVVEGWKQEGEFRSYTAENLFDYMNGNAEGYIIYGFDKMTGVTCAGAAGKIVIDVSHMDNSGAAYGLLAANLDARRPVEKLGMAGQELNRKFIFGKGNYVVEVSAESGAVSADALRQFAAAIERNIEGPSTLPEAVSWFPETGRKGSVRLVPQSLLGISMLKRGWLAEYPEGKAFLVQEETPETAEALFTKLKARFGGGEAVSIGAGGIRATDKYLGRLVIFRKGAHIGGYANLNESSDGNALGVALAARIP